VRAGVVTGTPARRARSLSGSDRTTCKRMPGRGLTLRATATPISPGEAEPVNPQSAAAPCG